ncbi:MAG: potassium channel family protein [Chloroflexota bacterium]
MNQYVVIGLGRFGASVALTLADMGYDVLGIDSSAERVKELDGRITQAVQVDATDEEVLNSFGVSNFDAAIVAIGNDVQASILITLMLKEHGVKFVVAKAYDAVHGRLLEKAGADRIVYPERDMGLRLAQSLTVSNVLDQLELSKSYSIAEVVVPASFSGRSLRQLDLRARYGLNVVAIKRDKNIRVSPQADDRLNERDIIVVIGANEGIRRLEAQ